MNAPNDLGSLEYASAFGFAATVEHLIAAIKTAGMSIFAQIDHAAGARQVGMVMPPTIVLIYGSPKGGTPVMLEAPQAALDLPLRVLVREGAGGGVRILFHPIADVMQRAGVSEDLAKKLEPAQKLLIKAVQV
jgi:uncharacterized protein (DUF302 family)